MGREGWRFRPGRGPVRAPLLSLVFATVAALGILLALLPEAGALSSRVEAEGMRPPAGGKVFGNARRWERGPAPRSGGTGSGRIVDPTQRISVRTRGHRCEGAARMMVKIDGALVMSRSVSSGGWTAYAADAKTGSGEHAIKISFTNDRRSASCDRALRLDSVTASAPAPAPSDGLPALSVSANHLVQAGRPGPVYFHGVNRDTLEWGQNNWGGYGGDGHFTARDYDNMAAWGANTVRIPLSQANWLAAGAPPPTTRAWSTRSRGEAERARDVRDPGPALERRRRPGPVRRPLLQDRPAADA